jgi:hypothetical protein
MILFPSPSADGELCEAYFPYLRLLLITGVFLLRRRAGQDIMR